MITLFLLSSFVEARHSHRKHSQKESSVSRFGKMRAYANKKRHAAAAKIRQEAARANTERRELAERARAKAADLNARRHAAAAALRGEHPQG